VGKAGEEMRMRFSDLLPRAFTLDPER
jgi:hypothetical protein